MRLCFVPIEINRPATIGVSKKEDFVNLVRLAAAAAASLMVFGMTAALADDSIGSATAPAGERAGDHWTPEASRPRPRRRPSPMSIRPPSTCRRAPSAPPPIPARCPRSSAEAAPKRAGARRRRRQHDAAGLCRQDVLFQAGRRLHVLGAVHLEERAADRGALRARRHQRRLLEEHHLLPAVRQRPRQRQVHARNASPRSTAGCSRATRSTSPTSP